MSKIEFFEHPHYEAMAPLWTKLRDLYEGKHEVLVAPEYLWLHELEAEGGQKSKLRAVRQNRSRYLNLMEPCGSRWVSFLFRKKPNVPDHVKKEIFGEKEYRDVNGRGVGFESFIRDYIGNRHVVFGKPIVFVDTTNAEATTIADARAKGVRPYMEIIEPLAAKDWQCLEMRPEEHEGQFELFRFEYFALERRSSLNEKPELVRYTKVLSLKDQKYHIAIYKLKSSTGDAAEWELTDEKPVDSLTEIPIATIETESFLKDAAEQQLSLFNLMSTESSILLYQAFQRVFIIGLEGERAKMEVGEWVYSFLNSGATVETLEPVNSETISRAIDRCIDYVFKIAFNQITGLSADSKESPSVEARREIKEEFTALVETTLTELEDVINQAVYFYAKAKGKAFEISNPEHRVTLDKRVTGEDITRLLEIWNSMRDEFKKIAEVRRDVMLKCAAEMGLGEEALEKIRKFDFEAEQKANEEQRKAMLKGIANGGDPGEEGSEEEPGSDGESDPGVQQSA